MRINFKFNKLEKPKEYAKALTWIPCCAALLEFIQWAANGSIINWYSLAKFSLLFIPYLALVLVENYLARKRIKAMGIGSTKVSVNHGYNSMTPSQVREVFKSIRPD